MNRIAVLLMIVVLPQFSLCQETPYEQQSFPLNSTKNLEFVNVKGTVVQHQGKTALRVICDKKSTESEELETMVVIPGIGFRDGIIEVEVSGEPLPEAFAQARGFVGIAFRVNKENSSQYECFYLRPSNGRANIQAQRNHSIQYISHPEYPWYRLREETPEMYESYVDLVPGKWTRIKIEVSGSMAKLYVDDAKQPSLIVNDLKHGESGGTIALWQHVSTLAHYRNLTVTAKK